jgi:two-component system cell cycle sensor histidine kinase/response regulator CckA
VAEGALGTGRPVVVVEGLNDDAGASVVLAGVRSVLCAPYFVRGAPAGCLYATHRLVGGLFDEADARVAEFMAALAGAALEQAAAFAEVEALLADKKRAEERFRSLIENATDLITVLGPDGTIRYESPALERIRGYRPEDLVGQSVFDSIHPDDRDTVTRELAEGVAQPGTMRSVELRVRHRDGSWRWLEAVGKVSRDAAGHLVAIVNSRDVTERRALEEQLRQSQRMEAVGRLAGGIAHDFNNLLTVILGRSHALRGTRAEDDPVRREADLIAETAEHAASLTRQLLAFGRRQVLQPKVLDLNEVVLGLEALLRRLIGEQIELVIALDPWLGRVKADPAQIEQVIINLAVNARDAMPRGGRLTIETADAASPVGAPNQVSGPVPHVRLSVSDTGVGMDAATRHSVFEPFFTTKAVGHGTGLGLATVYGIIEQSGGRIAVDSAPGKGARFDIHLPRVDASLDQRAGAGREAPRAALARGRETVLLAEDQGVLRDLFREVLLESGYRVLAAGNGEEALAVLERHDGPIDLVVTDVVMPIMGGRELVARLREAHPALKAIYMTGYAPDAVMPDRGDNTPVALLRKPFDPPVLTQAVREILDG